ncbi:2139_t:CDS:10, partial [Ambispora gerdemannii]
MESDPKLPSTSGVSQATPLTTALPSQADAEKIRLKRLAKLQQPKAEPQNDLAGPSTSIPKPASSPAKLISSAISSPIAKKIKQSEEVVSKPVTPTSKSQMPVKSFEDWQNDAISKVLQITLDKSAAEKSSNQLIYLNSLVAELREEEPENASRPFKLSAELIDRALVSRLSINPQEMSDDNDTLIAIVNLPKIPLFDYLLECWKRAVEIKRNLISRGKSLDPKVLNQRVAVMDKIKELTVSYAGLVIQMPDMFSQFDTFTALGPQQLVPRLLADSDTNEGLPTDFLREFIIRFEQDGFEEVRHERSTGTFITTMIFVPALLGLGVHIRSQNILGDFGSPLRTLTSLTEIKQFASILTTLEIWNPPNLPARALEVASFMGPFCRLSALPTDDEPTIIDSYVSNPRQRQQHEVDSAISSIRITLKGIQDTLFQIFNNIVRSPSPKAREAVLSYWATIIKVNEKRAQMQVDPAIVGTDGFLLNMTTILIKFASPFIDINYSKIDRIDVDYFRKSRRIDISQETKISANQQESDEYYKNEPENGVNFTSEIFFITIAMHHYGFLNILNKYNNLIRDLSEVQKQYDRAMAEHSIMMASSSTRMLSEAVLERRKIQLDKMTSHKLAYETQVLDQRLLSQSLEFYNLLMTWIVRIIDPKGKHPHEMIQLPLPSTPPQRFAMLPEYFIEDITEFFLFISRWDPMVIVQNSRDELLTFVITFLRSSSYIKNPYLKAKLVEVEQTGMHSQFYDKFNIRYNISQIFKTIWYNSAHREKLREESLKKESFVRFANLLMNDATYLLDECLTKLAEIHNIQLEMRNTVEWESRSQQNRQEREGFLRSLERQATSYMTLGDETVQMLKSMTEEVIEPFLTPEIVDRLAAMLDYNLALLVGPKSTELRVENPEKYRFRPRDLLSDILDLFLNLCERREFIQAVARDGRSYRKELFSKAAAIMLKHSRKDEVDIKKLEMFVNRVEETVKLDAESEEELKDVPDEFLDPLMCHLMEDPVILPESRKTVDRSTITTILLSDSKDPFNRKPLSIDQVIP